MVILIVTSADLSLQNIMTGAVAQWCNAGPSIKRARVESP